MRTSEELRAAGRADLTGRWNEAAMLTFVYSIFMGVTGALTSVISILLLPLDWSYDMTFVYNKRRTDNDPFELSHLIEGFRDYVRIFFTLLLKAVYTFLWLLLLIVPGIVASLSYAMTPYILRDHPEMRGNAAIERSMAMMRGHKMELFKLYLSFIGWVLLSMFTCGIGFFWLMPYIKAATVCFYEDLKMEYVEEATILNEPSDAYSEGNYQKTSDNYQK